MFWPDKLLDLRGKDHGWDKRYPVKDILRPGSLEGCDPECVLTGYQSSFFTDSRKILNSLVYIIESATHVNRAKYFKHKHLKDWVDKSQRIVRILMELNRETVLNTQLPGLDWRGSTPSRGNHHLWLTVSVSYCTFVSASLFHSGPCHLYRRRRHTQSSLYSPLSC